MFRPCIDLHDGKVKQIVGGTLSDSGEDIVENFVSELEPAYYSKMFQADGLKGGHVIMLGKGNEKTALEALGAYPGGLQVGGGITDANAKLYLEQGASHVIVTSYIFEQGKINFNKLERLVRDIKKERLVIDLSCRMREGKYYVVTDRWQKFTDFAIEETNLKQLEQYCDEFLIHGVDVEGKQQGILEDLIESLAAWTSIATTYAGGIRSMADIESIESMGNGRIHYTVGSALDIFGGRLKYKDIVAYQNKMKA